MLWIVHEKHEKHEKTAGTTFIRMRRARRARLLSFPRRSVATVKLRILVSASSQAPETVKVFVF